MLQKVGTIFRLPKGSRV